MYRELSPELAEIAKEELNETPKRTADDIKHLKEWISKQPHLKARTDDQWLVAMLRGCKFSLEKVKQKLDLYYTLRTTAPDITLRIRPTNPKFFEFFRLGSCLILPKPKQLYPRVILIRAGAYDPSTHSVADVMCMLYYLVQLVVIEDDVASVLGTKIVVDYEGVSMTHLMQATPTLLKKMFAVCQDSMPLRLKGSHHMNLPSGIEKIFTLISGFLNKKAKQRLKIHKTPRELIEVGIPSEMIPKEYGGSGGTVKDITEYWVNKFIEYQPWMQHEEQLGTDELKRPGDPINKDFISVDGSFRKLEID